MKYNWKEYYSQWDIYKAIEEENKKLKEMYNVYVTGTLKLEEENKKLKADTEHTIKFNNKIIGKLKLENDKLKVIIKNNDIEQKADWKHIEELEEENRNLKNELMEDMKTETKLNERIRFLEQCLDNKEKVNKSMREEIGKLVMKQ